MTGTTTTETTDPCLKCGSTDITDLSTHPGWPLLYCRACGTLVMP